MDYTVLTDPIELDGYSAKCVDFAINRASQAISKVADDPDKLRRFLEAEADEMARRAEYHQSLGWLYHEEVARCNEAEAKAFEIMIERFDNMV